MCIHNNQCVLNNHHHVYMPKQFSYGSGHVEYRRKKKGFKVRENLHAENERKHLKNKKRLCWEEYMYNITTK